MTRHPAFTLDPVHSTGVESTVESASQYEDFYTGCESCSDRFECLFSTALLPGGDERLGQSQVGFIEVMALPLFTTLVGRRRFTPASPQVRPRLTAG